MSLFFTAMIHRRRVKKMKDDLAVLQTKIKKQRGEMLYNYDPAREDEQTYIAKRYNEYFNSLYRDASELCYKIMAEEELCTIK